MVRRKSRNETGAGQAVAYRVGDLPPRQRPREEMDRLGSEHVSDHVLLAVLLRSGVRGISVVELARRLLHRYGTLTALAQASVEELAAVPGMGRVKAQVLRAALELARRLSEERLPPKRPVRTPNDVADLLREQARTLEEEAFWVLLLDARNRLKTRPLVLTRGLLNASLIHPREAFREAVRFAGAAVVFAHNHPSGDPTPSAQDIRMTKQLVEAGRIVDIAVLDHIILGKPSRGGGGEYFSMREAGVVEFEESA